MSQPHMLVALVTPFTRGGREVDWRRLDYLVDKLQLTGGLTGLWVNGTTGEWHSLTPEERMALLERILEKTAARQLVYQGVQAQRLSEALEIARHAREAGADAVFTLPPAYHKPSPESLERYLREINRAFQGPVYLYINPHATIYTPPPPVVSKLSEEGLIEGAKVTTSDLQYVESLALELNSNSIEFNMLAGSETLLPALVPLGARGAVSALANLAPHLPLELHETIRRGEVDKTRRLLSRALEARSLLSSGRGFIPGLKRGLHLRCRRFPPYVRLPHILETRVGVIKAALDLLRGYLVKC